MAVSFRAAILVSDNREIERKYSLSQPYFGTAPTGLFSGFAALLPKHPDLEVHVISCTQVPMESPEKLAANICFHSLHVPKWGWLKTGYFGCVQAIRRRLAEIGPDIVHAQGTERECAVGAALSPYPRVLTIHGNLRLIRRVLRPKPWSALALQAHLEGLVVPRFDGVVCITRYTESAVCREVPRTWVVPNAVDPDFLSLGDERQGRPAEASGVPVVLVVAHVDARKNQNDFLRSLDALAARLRFRIKFFGHNSGGEYGAEFERLVAERPWSEFGGMVSRQALREEFRAASVVALPTHEDNCPMVVLEAQAAGVPVMASNVGGVPDLVENGVTGLLTTPTEPASMAGALERLLTDPSLVSHLTTNARRQARERFAPAVIAQRHLDIYRELLSR
ncbi:MAG: glycosyltransferase family 4 protein [Terrimicrobiaceae bacterium]|nr:glycosyltransferase family 4 protein [Terrimicrobiaceae bacterium]